MKRKTFRIILFSFTALAMGGVVSGYFLYNKKHVNIRSADAIQVNAVELYQVFSTDSVAANKKFGEKIVQVRGIVSEVSKNQQNQPVVLLKTGTDGASVNCTLEGPMDNSAPGSNIQVKGLCNGIGQGDADMGIAADVYLTRCYIEK